MLSEKNRVYKYITHMLIVMETFLWVQSLNMPMHEALSHLRTFSRILLVNLFACLLLLQVPD